MAAQNLLKELGGYLIVLLVRLMHKRGNWRLAHAANEFIEVLALLRFRDLDLAHPLPAERADPTADDRIRNPSPLYRL
jgi:hypothetical protein